MFSNGPSRSSLPLATQLSATPPAMTRFLGRPVVSQACLAERIIASSQTRWMLAAMSMCFWSSRESLLRGGPPKRSANFDPVIRRPWLYV